MLCPCPPLQGPLPVPVPRVALGTLANPSGPWEPTLPPTSPLDFLVYPSGFVGGTPPTRGSATVASLIKCVRGVREGRGVGGWALEGRRHGHGWLGFEGLGLRFG
jgi:hypothetical protein